MGPANSWWQLRLSALTIHTPILRDVYDLLLSTVSARLLDIASVAYPNVVHAVLEHQS